MPLLPLLVKTPGPSSEAPSLDVTQLQEETNKALGHLLATKSSIDTHWRKQVSDFGMALCQNESEVTKAIKEAKALCVCTIRNAETCWTVLISEAKVQTYSLYQGDWGQLCSHLSRGGELLFNSYQGGRVPRHFPSPAQFNNHMPKTFGIWRQRPLKKREGTASPSSLPVVLPSGPALPRPME